VEVKLTSSGEVHLPTLLLYIQKSLSLVQEFSEFYLQERNRKDKIRLGNKPKW